MAKIIFTGGGSGGHVVPGLTLIDYFKNKNTELDFRYMGDANGIERSLVEAKGIPFKSISTGKLRRYISFQNFLDLFKILFGLLQSIVYLLKEKNEHTILFSTGGFVSVPPVIAAKLCGIKIFIHEQTSRAGLANRISAKFADKIIISFNSSKIYFPSDKTELLGLPLREECFSAVVGSKSICGLRVADITRPILFITGGGNGSLLLNKWVEESLPKLEKEYLVIHQVGKNFVEELKIHENENYRPVAFVGNEMIDIFKLATFVVSRAGANTVCELISLGKRSIFVPLKIAQKNEQYYNASEAKEKLGSLIVEEDEVKNISLSDLLQKQNQDEFRRFNPQGENPTCKIVQKILQVIKP